MTAKRSMVGSTRKSPVSPRGCRPRPSGSVRAGPGPRQRPGPASYREKRRLPELDAIAWYGGNSGGETYPVGRKVPNRCGLHDMLGNVYEWCQDAAEGWDALPRYQPEPAVDPVPPGQGSYRVNPGGSWDSRARGVRAAGRYAYPRDGRDGSLGFRLAGGQESAPPQPAGRRAAKRRAPPWNGTRHSPASTSTERRRAAARSARRMLVSVWE